jgi:hypothetical protein
MVCGWPTAHCKPSSRHTEPLNSHMKGDCSRGSTQTLQMACIAMAMLCRPPTPRKTKLPVRKSMLAELQEGTQLPALRNRQATSDKTSQRTTN